MTIPTELALAESERLVPALREQNIAVRRGVINRIVSAEADGAYAARLAKGQQRMLAELDELAGRCDVRVTQVPYFDAEVRAVYGLRAMGTPLFDKAWAQGGE